MTHAKLTKDDIPHYTGRDDWTDYVDAGDGYTVRVRVQYDECLREPWTEEDGHGSVSEWERRDKRPGELTLSEDHGSKLFYDFAEAVKIARRDGWDSPPYKTGTPGERAHRAAMADFEHLRAWCRNEWHYIVVGVEVSRNGAVVDMDSCGGIEDYGDYWREHAADVANGTINADQQARKQAAVRKAKETRERKYWACRDVLTVAA